MKEQGCARRWEVEAVRDGRLDGAALTHHERHLQSCADCSRERRMFEKMQRAAVDSAPKQNELALRRLRQSLLEQAHSGDPTPRRRPWARVLAIAATMLLVFGVVWRVAERRPDPPTSPAASVQVAAVGAADWSQFSTSRGHRVVLRSGTLDVAVTRRPVDAGLVVQLPDGELEDIGTVFRVSVRDGRTEAIDVREGAVSFRRHRGAAIQIGAGERWRAEPSRAQPAPTSDLPAAMSPPRKPSAVAASAKPPNTASDDAAAGREEDEAYLRVLALVREGRAAEARLAARDYLKRFPSGFRRSEVERIAR
jgi:ferric-dicitrate binding protein FerR (iron transport regulator)